MHPESYYNFDLVTVDTSNTDIRKETELLELFAKTKMVKTDYNACSKRKDGLRAACHYVDESIIPKTLIEMDGSCGKTDISREEAKEVMRRFVKAIYGISNEVMVYNKGKAYPVEIERVIFNDPATIVIWSDGTKTVVKCANEEFDKEKGLAMAICKRVLGNKGNYFNEFRKWIEDEEEE